MNIYSNIIQEVNHLSEEGIPFLLLVDFEGKKPSLYKIDELTQESIWIDFPNFRNNYSKPSQPVRVEAYVPVGKKKYKQAYDIVHRNLMYGNSFLTNLTMPTPLWLSASMLDLYLDAQSKYKVFFKDQWCCFSPEIFVRIQNGKIVSYPMKGTIDAAIPDADKIILQNEKETAEHYTIVDLIRNDLSKVASNVNVKRFRYIDTIHTTHKTLLQVSSEICGDLPDDWRARLGDILFSLLPAGSVSGAPKEKTLDIIREAEREARGFYTGVAVYFDGECVDSCVMIRFVERYQDHYRYRSGGGITVYSNTAEEYQELNDKIYVPRI